MTNTFKEHVANLHLLANKIILSDGYILDELDEIDVHYTLEHISKTLNVKEEVKSSQKYELMLRLALHYAPSSAIEYDTLNPKRRSTLIRNHLKECFNFNEENAKKVAHLIAVILTNWDEQREPVTHHKEMLLKKQNFMCNHCKVSFLDEEGTHFPDDPYKPYCEDVETWTEPEVDHLQAVSSVGDNNIDNLQVLCKLCNRGKSDGLGMNITTEIKHAGKDISDIPSSHIRQMFYYVVKRAQNRCQQCSAENSELTMRKIHPNGGFIRTNLRALCYTCMKVM